MLILKDRSWNTVSAVFNCFECVNGGAPSTDDVTCLTRSTEMEQSSAIHFQVRHPATGIRHAWVYQHPFADAILIYLANSDQVDQNGQSIVPGKTAIACSTKHNEHDEAARIIHTFLYAGEVPTSNVIAVP